MNFNFSSHYQPAAFPSESHLIPAHDHFFADCQQASPPIIDHYISPAHRCSDSFFQYLTVTTPQPSDFSSPPSQQRSASHSPSYSPAYADYFEGDQVLKENVWEILNKPFPNENENFYDNPQAPAVTNSSSYSEECLSSTLVEPCSEIRMEAEGRADTEVSENSLIETYLKDRMPEKKGKKNTNKNQKKNRSLKGHKHSLELEIIDLREEVKNLQMKRDQCKLKYDIMQYERINQ